MKPIETDVIIIGAGAAGLMAARVLAEGGRKVMVLEAKARCGGRIHTYTDEHFEGPVELGAEFVHGDLPLTLALAKEAAIEVIPVEGAHYAYDGNRLVKDESNGLSKEVEEELKNLKDDLPVAEFLNNLRNKVSDEVKNEVRGYVSGYYAAEVSKASTLAMKEEWFAESGADKRLQGGYKRLIDYLQNRCEALGVVIKLENPIKKINWRQEQVTISSSSQQFYCKQVLVTVPLGVLQAHAIDINPFPQTLKEAIAALGFGAVIKFQFQYKKPFWNNAAPDVSMLFSNETIPTWWTQHPNKNNLLTGWVAGDGAIPLAGLNRFQLKEKALQSLSHIFKIPVAKLEEGLTAWYINNWNKGLFARGGYSFATVAGEAWKKRAKPYFENKLFFAGECWYSGKEIGTVEAALQTGKAAAEAVLA